MVSSDMFDWSDEEFTNIIWGETGESGDHIIPYSESKEGYCKTKEWGQDSSSINSGEQKSAATESDFRITNFDGGSSYDPCEGTSSTVFQISPWSNLSLTNDTKNDADSMGNPVSETLTQISKFDSSAETTKVDKASGYFPNSNAGKEEDRFADYQWDGSFDDLDQILSNDDMIFGNTSIGITDEIWSSSKELASSPVNPIVDSPRLDLGGLRGASEQFEIKEEFLNEEEHDFTLGFGNDDDTMSDSLKTVSAISSHPPCTELERNNSLKDERKNATIRQDVETGRELTVQKAFTDKGHKQNKLLKGRKKFDEKVGLEFQQDPCANWSLSGAPRNPFAQVKLSSASVVERQLKGPEPLLYQHINNQYVPPSYGNITNPYSVPVLPHVQPTDNQSMLFGYQVSMEKSKPINNSEDSSMKYQTLTPQEKIEKLRRRQQMQAMLAIQKQQQQLGHDFPCIDPSVSYCSQDNIIHRVSSGTLHVDDFSSVPKFDSNSPGEQEDCNTASMGVNDYSAEDAILHSLQEVVAKLDVRVRLCIRDSLYRLAQSATQRHFSSDTSSTNNSCKDDRSGSKEENYARNAKIPEMETESNPIDRTVAHLLFHRPMEYSSKRLDTPDSPGSAKFQSEHKIAKSPLACSPRSVKDRRNFGIDGSQCSSLLTETQPFGQGKPGFCLDISENASNTAHADTDVRDVNPTRRKEELCISI